MKSRSQTRRLRRRAHLIFPPPSASAVQVGAGRLLASPEDSIGGFEIRDFSVRLRCVALGKILRFLCFLGVQISGFGGAFDLRRCRAEKGNRLTEKRRKRSLTE